jgi:hypothetical protein
MPPGGKPRVNGRNTGGCSWIQAGKKFFEPDVKLVTQRRGDVLTIRFLNGAVDSKYLLGPGVTALVGANELLGLNIEMIDFIWPEPDWMKP